MAGRLKYPEHILRLKTYVPGLPIEEVARRVGMPPSNIAKLASNENPLGPSPLALRALADAAPDMSRYPDNDCTALVAAIAAHCGVPPEWVVVGAGSESVIGMAVSALLAPWSATLYSQYSFQAYVNAVQRVGATAIVVPSPEFKVDLAALRQQITPEVTLIYIANPGNPTGTLASARELEDFLEGLPRDVVVLLDEAYFEYVPDSLRGNSVTWVHRYPNLIVTRTFSKAYGLAGLRAGYGIAQQPLADTLRRVRSPFSVSQAAQIAAAAALDDVEFLDATVECNRQGYEQITSTLSELGIRFLPSSANFVLANVGDGSGLARRLEKHGLIVRPVTSYGLDEWLRISIGTAQENARLADALKSELSRGDGR
ncbi:MAG: hisC3 [Ramlibacter sp.]|nr:hisC3 [Ramlibacter sp.]